MNGEVVTEFGQEDVDGKKQKSIIVGNIYSKIGFALLECDITSIVTKEQFKQMEYKVKEE